jgi:hypothetical protein
MNGCPTIAVDLMLAGPINTTVPPGVGGRHPREAARERSLRRNGPREP